MLMDQKPSEKGQALLVNVPKLDVDVCVFARGWVLECRSYLFFCVVSAVCYLSLF